MYWKVITETERFTIPWGYDINLMPLMENRRVSNSYGVPHRLVAIDKASKKTVPNVAALTMAELEASLKQHNVPLDSVIPAKHYQLEFEFKNVGGTVVSDLRISVDPQMPDTGAWNRGGESQPIELASQRSVFKVVDLTEPVNAFLPDRLRFRVKLTYRNADDETIARTESLYYHAGTSSINFGQ